MAELMQEPVKTFTIGFDEADFSEMKYAEQVARHQQHRASHRDCRGRFARRCCRRSCKHYGQPFADSSAIPTYYVSRMARAARQDGAERRRRRRELRRLQQLRIRASAGCRTPPTPASAGGKRQTGSASCEDHPIARCARASSSGRRSLDEMYGTSRRPRITSTPASDAGCCSRSIAASGAGRRSRSPARCSTSADAPLVTRLQHLDLMAYLPFDILTKVDIAAMANSLEVRVPLLDHHVVELAATMPSELKLKPIAGGFDKKHMLKELARRRYPAGADRSAEDGIWRADRRLDGRPPARATSKSSLLESPTCRAFSRCRRYRRDLAAAISNAATGPRRSGTCCFSMSG